MNYINLAINKFNNFRKKKYLAEDSKYSDIYLNSFPKSGNTWLSFLISNVSILINKENIKVNFFNLHQFIPDIHAHKKLGDTLLKFPANRIIKSHSSLNYNYKFVIYLIRNPINVMVSYFYFQKNFFGETMDLSEFIRSKKFGIHNWTKHVESWLRHPPDISFYPVKYENLKNNPNNELSDLYKQLGYSVPDEVIERAVELSSFEQMKKLEEEYNLKNHINMETNFVRENDLSKAKLELSAEDIDYINSSTKNIREIFGY